LFDLTDEDATNLSNFEKYVEKIPDLVKTLNDDKEITVFVPTNDAFGKLAPDVATNLLTGDNTPMWKEHLEDLLNYHVLPIVVPSKEIIFDGLKKSTTLSNKKIQYTLSNTKIGGISVTKILVNKDAEVVEADIDIVNGIVHVIDDVLLPPWVSKSIIDIATDENTNKSPGGEDLDMFVVNLKEVFDADNEFQLPSILSAPGGYTVFAPTTAAFIKDVSNLVDLSIDQLSSVLNYHVVEGVYPESVLVDGFTLETLQGEEIKFKRNKNSKGVTKVNDETIITPNILANNGIVHVIDGVLIPEG
jgi:uncharacterized surface protein with fasciclin (FAS1) repeats